MESGVSCRISASPRKNASAGSAVQSAVAWIARSIAEGGDCAASASASDRPRHCGSVARMIGPRCRSTSTASDIVAHEAFELRQVDLDHDHPDQFAAGLDAAGIVEQDLPRLGLVGVEHRVVRTQRRDEIGRGRGAASPAGSRSVAATARPLSSSMIIEAAPISSLTEISRCETLREIVRVQRADQRRIAAQQQRHHRVALQFAHQVADIKRLAHLGPVLVAVGVAFGQELVGEPDHHDRQTGKQQQQQPNTPGQARRNGCVFGGVRPGSWGQDTPAPSPAQASSGERHRRCQRCEQRGPVLAAMGGFGGAFGMRHHAEHAAIFRQDTGDVGAAAVGIAGIGEGDAVLGAQPRRSARPRRRNCRRDGRSGSAAPAPAHSRL